MTTPLENPPHGRFRLGEGRLSAFIAVTLASLSLLSVVAFMFPSWLTTPELRQGYDLSVVRALIAAGLIASALFASFALWRKAERKMAIAALVLAAIAMLLGGPDVAAGALVETPFYVGLDWFVIGLLTTGGGFILIEKLAPLRREQPVLRDDWTLDMKHFFMYHLLIGFFLFAGNYVVHEWFSWAIVPALGERVRALPFAVQFFLILAAVDFAQYWIHRQYHENSFFWRIHSVHHSTEHMDWLASSRLHLIEPLITRTAGLLVISALGFEQGPINAYILFIGFHATFIHANCGIDFSAVERWFVTPKHHHWHHAKDERAINKNYAVHLAFLDRLFGTWFLPKEWPEGYGVVHGAPPRSLLKQQLHPFVK